ncbi:MAG: molybdopterin-dependent oxidoreductase [Paracoccaceae bacterium]
MDRKTFFLLLAGLIGTLFGTVPVTAQEEIILEISKGAGDENSSVAQLSLQDLLDMPVETVRTSTVWTDGVQEFTGVSLQHLVTKMGADSGTLQAVAMNDYIVEIPVSDAVEKGPIIAYARNGEHMSIRDKGPLWVIYPYDSNAKYRSEEIYARSIWQLNRLVIIP